MAESADQQPSPPDRGEAGAYLHGYSPEEQLRLRKQARFGEFIVYQDVDLSGVQRLLEVGCGVGAQSEILLRRFPDIQLTGVDREPQQLAAANQLLGSLPFASGRVQLLRMDASQLEFEPGSFDGAFLCWILEHVNDPETVLAEVRRVLRPGARIYVTEVMNSSFFLDPYSPATWKYWMTFNEFQLEHGGDPFVGAKLGNLLLGTGFESIVTRAKILHFDNRHPVRRHEAIAYWTELLLSAGPQLLEAQVVTTEHLAEVERELRQVSRNPHAVFFYSFMQATARVGG
ncbi:MAG: class I SAM-dependent methyltransferase [Planctomycetota bacterium]